MDLCRSYGWEFLLTFKEGVMPKVRKDACDGAFVTSFEVGDRDRAVKVVEWGRRRWNVENGFKVEKHDGFGLVESTGIMRMRRFHLVA